MKYITAIGILAFLSILRLNAQSDFRNGYIINNENDTINGLIAYQGNNSNALKCILKKEKNSKGQIFTPEEIKAYRFTDSKYYVSKPVKTDNGTKQLFLEYLINGVVDIYYYHDDFGKHFLVNIGHKLYELKNKETEVNIGDQTYIKETKAYIGILKLLFHKSPSILKRVDNIGIDRKSLLKLAQDYQKEISPDQKCIIYEKKVPNTFGVVIGMNGLSFSQTGAYSEELYYMNNSQFGFKIFPTIGLYYKVNLPVISERIFFQYEGTYSHIHLTTNNSYFESLYGMTFLNDINLTQNIFNNLGYFRYEFPKGKIRPTFQIGGFVNYFFKTDYTRYLEVINSLGNTRYKGYQNDSPFSKFDYGINIGAGLIINYLNNKELLLDLRYQRGFGWLNELNTNRFIINADFQIGK